MTPEEMDAGMEQAELPDRLMRLAKNLGRGAHVCHPDVFPYCVQDVDDVAEAAVEIRRLRAEVARLRDLLTRAGLECFMRSGTPQEVSEHMRAVASACTEREEDLRAEIARLKAELDRQSHAALDAIAVQEDDEMVRRKAAAFDAIEREKTGVRFVRLVGAECCWVFDRYRSCYPSDTEGPTLLAAVEAAMAKEERP